MSAKRILVTGGAGFIGSALVRHLISATPHAVLNIDKLTYAGDRASLATVDGDPRHRFIRGDIADADLIGAALADFQPDVVTHLAAETHVDRSIDAPAAFIHSNIVGTHVLLAETLAYWRGLDARRRERFRFHHISTDEVFGALGAEGMFTEATAYDPRSPYSASKAASDHLVRAWGHTYGLPVLITNSSNTYGPWQFPEKLIPLMIIRAISGEDLPVYGDGANVRDWLHVDDHVRALIQVFEAGAPGATYIVGGRCQRSNLEVVRALCRGLDRLAPRIDGRAHETAIRYVPDRPGHDRRYAVDPTRLERDLAWRAAVTFEAGIEETLRWYLDNAAWWRPILDNGDAGRRLGLEQAAAR